MAFRRAALLLGIAALRAGGSEVPSLDKVQAALSRVKFHPVVKLPPPGQYRIRDFSAGPDGNDFVGAADLQDRGLKAFLQGVLKWRKKKGYDVGKYNERRPGMYSTDLFLSGEANIDGYTGVRDIHMGVDIGGPLGTAGYAPDDGFIKYFGYNEAHGDYGHVIVTEHRYTVPGTQESFPVYMLFGHLSKESLHFKYQGKAVKAGDVIGWFGPPSENGGWPEHVHFQLSLVEPSTHDMPGTVSRAQLPDALRTFPDPRLVLGSVYRD
uniref:M23ase beta-sheet core domain-containing protein n=1 Tax=Pinguiococcus pyrenoidosus TaxID=172671 RepID=A0A7R9U954_9STRA|mmetsp:Transcript_19804/g.74872  ORF Transcript_19804/g.74872 Transcript_19804/m.74872 type:complete len:266 (+) Transcript_19804:202-999(+)